MHRVSVEKFIRTERICSIYTKCHLIFIAKNTFDKYPVRSVAKQAIRIHQLHRNFIISSGWTFRWFFIYADSVSVIIQWWNRKKERIQSSKCDVMSNCAQHIHTEWFWRESALLCNHGNEFPKWIFCWACMCVCVCVWRCRKHIRKLNFLSPHSLSHSFFLFFLLFCSILIHMLMKYFSIPKIIHTSLAKCILSSVALALARFGL